MILITIITWKDKPSWIIIRQADGFVKNHNIATDRQVVATDATNRRLAVWTHMVGRDVQAGS